MLRELNENEMMMVSGGTESGGPIDEVVVTAQRIYTPDASASGYQVPVAGSNGWSYEYNGQTYRTEDEWFDAMRESIARDLVIQRIRPAIALTELQRVQRAVRNGESFCGNTVEQNCPSNLSRLTIEIQ